MNRNPQSEAIAASNHWQHASLDSGDDVQRVDEIFGIDVFDMRKMRQTLPKSVYQSVETVLGGGASPRPALGQVTARRWRIGRMNVG